MKRIARPTKSEAPRYPTFAQARSTRGALAAGLGALLMLPLAGCLDPTANNVDSDAAIDAGTNTWISTDGAAPPFDAGQPELDAGEAPDAAYDAGESPSGDAVQEDGGI